jgi:hypothetical protein
VKENASAAESEAGIQVWLQMCRDEGSASVLSAAQEHIFTPKKALPPAKLILTIFQNVLKYQ